MSKAFLTEDTPSLFDNVCQVSKTAKTDKRPSKSDYLEFRKSLRELDFREAKKKTIRSFSFYPYYFAEYNKDAKKEFNLMYDFLEKNFKSFKAIFESMHDYKNDLIRSKGGKICEFLRVIKNAFFKNLYLDYDNNKVSRICKEAIERVTGQKDFNAYLDYENNEWIRICKGAEIDDFYTEIVAKIKPVSKRLKILKKEFFRYKKLRELYTTMDLAPFTYKTDEFYYENEEKIQNYLFKYQKGFEKRLKGYGKRMFREYSTNAYLIACFEGFVKVLNEDKEKMREFSRLLELLKEKAPLLTTKFFNEESDYSFYYVGYKENQLKLDIYKCFIYKLKKNSKAIRDFLKSQKNTNKEEK